MEKTSPRTTYSPGTNNSPQEDPHGQFPEKITGKKIKEGRNRAKSEISEVTQNKSDHDTKRNDFSIAKKLYNVLKKLPKHSFRGDIHGYMSPDLIDIFSADDNDLEESISGHSRTSESTPPDTPTTSQSGHLTDWSNIGSVASGSSETEDPSSEWEPEDDYVRPAHEKEIPKNSELLPEEKIRLQNELRQSYRASIASLEKAGGRIKWTTIETGWKVEFVGKFDIDLHGKHLIEAAKSYAQDTRNKGRSELLSALCKELTAT